MQRCSPVLLRVVAALTVLLLTPQKRKKEPCEGDKKRERSEEAEKKPGRMNNA